MLVAAAVCPQTPLLVPEVAGGAAEELADVRSASLEAVARLWDARPDVLLVLAPGGPAGARRARLAGTFSRFGLDLVVGDRADGPDADPKTRPEPCCGLLVGRWMLDTAAPAALPVCEGWEIGEDTEPEQCAEIGLDVAGRSDRVALLAMADGSARRTLKAPGYLDERAVPFDDRIARALADADPAALAAVDPAAAGELMAAGRAPWQVLAAAAAAACTGSRSRSWRGALLSYAAPYGVGYFSALWTLDAA